MPLLFKVLAITGSAMFAGVMLAIGIILVGYWKSLPPADFLEWFAQNNHLVMRAIPFAVLPTLVGLAGMLWFDWSDSTNRVIWLGAAACIVAVLAITIVYYVPSNAAFAAKAVPVDQVSSKLDTRLIIHNLRIMLALVASALGVYAVSR
ncbi:DUF1772 domain-containing protein [Bradyrhizobium sp. BRP22]|uniref:anthrone oxygenase family protein n=1 Tax=Bradyrhizobium sp. BRP22 TaxID=2793821 RepID=UPI001CD5610E|nr:DUF1772 domain-containing protein [Bradyrhizobium sp. BRP22]MCA1458765.1 DUF1772 domain-containing protein [Bradyrhizobium sp. BRP22]